MNRRRNFNSTGLPIWLWIFLLLLPGLTYAQETKTKNELRVLSYNIHHGEGVDRKLDLKRIADIMLSVKPDLVAVQEVDVETTRVNKVHQARKLAELTGMHFAFGANIPFGGGQYGNCVLSRYPIRESKNIKLPNHRQGEQRGVLCTQIQPDFLKEPLFFWSTHFDHRSNDSERIASAKVCNELLAKSDGNYHFLAGDFNDVIGSSTLDVLETVWSRSNTSPLPTVPVAKPRKQIDFVWAAKKSKVVCVQTKVLSEAVASDHRAILAVYRLSMSPNDR